MGKKPKKKQVEYKSILNNENALPQNIINVGNRVLQNKNIYIHQQVYKTIAKFTENKTTNESGGILIGNVIEELGKTNIIISSFVEAKHCEATPTTLKFTHETWEYVHSEIDKKYKGKKIVGWIHTHPDFGIFLSEYDRFIQDNFFKEDYQIAYVVDPIKQIEGFYFWINGNIEKSEGFYIFDEIGKKIAITDISSKEKIDIEENKGILTYSNIVIACLCVLIVILFFNILNLNSRVKDLNTQVNRINQGAGQNMNNLYQEIQSLKSRIVELEKTQKPVENEESSSSKANNSGSNSSSNNNNGDSSSKSSPAVTSSNN